MNKNNYLITSRINISFCIKISIILFIARYFTMHDMFFTNHFVNTLFRVSPFTLLLSGTIVFPEISVKVKLKRIVLILVSISILINIIYFSLFITYKLGYGFSEDYYVSIYGYHKKKSGRHYSRFDTAYFKTKFNDKKLNVDCNNKTINNLIDEYGDNFQDSIQMHLKVKKVLPSVYCVESYEIVKKHHKNHS